MIAIDIETTGLDVRSDDIIEFSAHTDGMSTDMFIESDMESCPEALSVHHLTRDVVASRSCGRSRVSCMESIARLLSESGETIAVHNATFVFPMLLSNMVRCGCGVGTISKMSEVVPIDVMVMDSMLNPHSHGRPRTLSMLRDMYGVHGSGPKSALSDSKAIFRIATMQVGKLVECGVDPESLPKLVSKRAVERQSAISDMRELRGDDPLDVGYPYPETFLQYSGLMF